MRRVAKRCFTEFYFLGCNPSYIETSDGIVMIDSPQRPIDAMRWREHMEEKGSLRYLINTEPHADHISGNAYFPHVEVIGHIEVKEKFDHYLWQYFGVEEKRELIRQTDPDSLWLFGHPDYPYANPPRRTFIKELELRLGSHTIHCLHMPGHTSAQTSVYVPEEGIVFTGDNVFHRCRTWIQEGNPWEWLKALDEIAALDADTIIPGHGEPCGKDYLKEQAAIIQNWLGFVQGLIDKGMSEDELIEHRFDVRALDPYPMGQRIESLEPRAVSGTLRNLYRLLTGGSGKCPTCG
jgi:cyclase